MGENGYQPLSYMELATYADRVLKLHPSSAELYYKVMEATDNGILYDYYASAKAKRDAELEEAKKNPRKRPRK